MTSYSNASTSAIAETLAHTYMYNDNKNDSDYESAVEALKKEFLDRFMNSQEEESRLVLELNNKTTVDDWEQLFDDDETNEGVITCHKVTTLSGDVLEIRVVGTDELTGLPISGLHTRHLIRQEISKQLGYPYNTFSLYPNEDIVISRVETTVTEWILVKLEGGSVSEQVVDIDGCYMKENGEEGLFEYILKSQPLYQCIEEPTKEEIRCYCKLR